MIFYFGTFDPIHVGHLTIAKRVEEIMNDDVIFIPSYDSPWKPNITKFQHRINMLALCNVKYMDIEKTGPVPSYTYWTIDYLYELFGTVKMIIGYDQFFSLPEWEKPEILKKLTHYIVIPRGGIERPEWKLKAMKEEGWKYTLLDIPMINVSSTEIRKGNLNLVTPEVREYILKNNLY